MSTSARFHSHDPLPPSLAPPNHQVADPRRRLVLAIPLAGAAGAIASALLASSALAQYRHGLPDVLVPAAVEPAPADVERQFRDTYSRAGRPRIVLYWNRELDDELVDRKQQRVDVRAAAVETGPVAIGAVRVDSSESIANPLSRGGVPPWLARVETAFVQQFANHGARVVDRATILRREHAAARKANAAKGAADTHVNEADALASHADLLLEIIFVEAGRTADKVAFKVLAKDTRTGVMPFSVTTRARSEALTGTDFIAGDGGFVRKPRTLDQAGRQLALDAMAAWNAAAAGR